MHRICEAGGAATALSIRASVEEGQPDSPTARQPDSPTARQPDSPTARQPDSPTGLSAARPEGRPLPPLSRIRFRNFVARRGLGDGAAFRGMAACGTNPQAGRQRTAAVSRTGAAFAFALLLGAGAAQAQVGPVQENPCGSTTTERVEQIELPGSERDIVIRVEGRKGDDRIQTGNDPGVYGKHPGTGGIKIDLRNSVVCGVGNPAVIAYHGTADFENSASDAGTSMGDIDIDVAGSFIESSWWGVSGIHAGAGDIDIDVEDSTVLTLWARYTRGVYGWHSGSGDIRLRVRDSIVEPRGPDGRGIFASHWREDGANAGDIHIHVSGTTVFTNGFRTPAVYGYHYGAGDIDIAVTGGSSVTTHSIDSHGVYGRHQGSSGNIVLHVGDSTITARGRDSHGVYARGENVGRAIDILIRDGVIRATGANAHGVAVRGGLLGADGYRRQTVSVDGEVWGGSRDGAGIALVGGGRVIIGPNARIGAESGVAIRVTRTDPTDEAESPRLYVDLTLDGRRLRLGELLQGEVVNDGGTTAWAANGVTLFDDAAGGARDVTVANGIRDVAATGTSLSTLAFTQEVAPRAAVYEALPGFLLRLDEADGGLELRAPDSPLWLRVGGGRGSYRPGSATGARQRYTRYGVEAGVDFALDDEGFAGWAGVRAVSGSARVSAATGGGRIESSGVGLAGGLSWEDGDGFYGTGRVSLTRYGVDFSSSGRGRLASGAAALVHALDLEGGRRFALDGETAVTPWARLGYAGASMDRVTDAVGSRIVVADADRRTLGVGADAEIELDPGSGEERLALRGSFGLERPFGGGTDVRVFDEKLASKASDGVRVLLGAGAVWETGPFTLEGGLSANGLSSDDRDLTGFLNLRAAF